MNILFIIGSLSGGGAERVASIIANSLESLGCKITFLLIGNNRVAYSISPSINIIDCSQKYSGKGLGFIKRLCDIRSNINHIQPDVIISFTVAVNIYAILSNMLNSTPLVISERNDPKYDPTSLLLRLARRLLYPFADRFVFQNNSEKEYFSKSIKNRSVVIPNPLNSSLPLPLYNKPEKRFVMVSRLEPQKNISLALQAFNLVTECHPDYTLEIYGEGSLKNMLLEEIDRLGLNDSVFLKGYSTDIYNDINNAYGFLVTSTYEGMCNSLLEAMGLGIVPISTNYSNGAAREIITDGFNGFIVPVNGYVDLASRINYLIDNPNIRDEMCRNAIIVRNTYSIASITNSWIDLLKECLI